MATAILDEWTEEKCLQLIREYRTKPILWDKKDPNFFKKDLKPIAWKEIGAAVNIPEDQCKHKMIILMSSFRREKAKIMNSIKNLNGDNRIDSSQAYKSTWFAFKEMAFLLDKDSERKRQLNTDSDEVDEHDAFASNAALTLLSYHSDPPVRQVKKARTVRNERTSNILRVERKEPEVPQQQPRPGPSQTALERDEEIKSFTSFIGNKMKKYSDTTKNAVQQAICDIIFRADQDFYENNCYEKFTIVDDDAASIKKEMFDEDVTLIKIQKDSDSD